MDRYRHGRDISTSLEFDPIESLLATSLEFDPIESLLDEAMVIRQAMHGRVMTYSPKVFVPLTTLCRDRCGYCTFARPPARTQAPFLEPDEVLEIAKRGARAGCKEALFTLGEAPQDRYSVAAEWLDAHGYESTVDYLVAMCALVLDETGLLPHSNAGALDGVDLERLRRVAPSQGMMLESLSDRLHERGGPHYRCPDKTATRRLETLDVAGRLRIPFTTGILVGIGETFAERIEAINVIVRAHERYGHVQEVIVQNFVAKPDTPMRAAPAPSRESSLRTIAAARILLPPEVHLQAPPNLSEDFGALLSAGIDDWGGVSPVTPDHVNPGRAWPTLDELCSVTESHGFTLAPRLTVYPEYVCRRNEWLDAKTRFPVLVSSDAQGLARDDDWSAGGEALPRDPRRFTGARSVNGQMREILDGVVDGERVDEDQIAALFGARGSELAAVCEVADHLRRDTVGDVVTYVVNRNINYTNICTFKCRFCGFSKGPLSLNLRGNPYLLTLDDIAGRVVEATEKGATEVCLQGGIHPKFDGSYYMDVLRAVKTAAPDVHVHGFTALEVTEAARRSGVSLFDYLAEMRDAGLSTLPGTAAEILDDEVRALLCADKIDTDEWLYAHETAHSVGLRSNVTIMYGHIDRPRNWARHICRTRDLQDRTGGFTEFVPLPFVHMAAPIFLQRDARPGPTFREALLMHAVGRIAYTGAIDNIQVSWVKMGVAGSRIALESGCNDIGGTLMGEDISRAAGASHGQEMTRADFDALVEPLGRPLRQRSTLYARPPGGGHCFRGKR